MAVPSMLSYHSRTNWFQTQRSNIYRLRWETGIWYEMMGQMFIRLPFIRYLMSPVFIGRCMTPCCVKNNWWQSRDRFFMTFGFYNDDLRFCSRMLSHHGRWLSRREVIIMCGQHSWYWITIYTQGAFLVGWVFLGWESWSEFSRRAFIVFVSDGYHDAKWFQFYKVLF